MRVDLLEIFRQATLVSPLVTWSYCESWLITLLRGGQTEADWEALVAVLEGVLSRILLVTERPSVLSGLALLEQALTSPTPPSLLLSCISAMFVFLSMSAAGSGAAHQGAVLLPRVLDKIFQSFASQDKNLRRHAAASVVKIALKYPLLLLPIFEQIHATVQRVSPGLGNMERITLQEALLLISNHFADFDRQTQFIGEVKDKIK